MFFLYSFLFTIGFIILLPRFLFDAVCKGKYAAGFWQRLGFLPGFVPDEKAVLWIHCVSVGECNTARPLVTELKTHFPDYRLVISTTTKTGQKLARQIFANEVDFIFYFPFDWRFSVRRVLKLINPSAVLLMETELWFNFLHVAHKNGVKIALINGRLSERSAARYLYFKKFIRRVLSFVDIALMQAGKDAKRLEQLGVAAEKIKITGNIKFDQKINEAEIDLSFELRKRFGISKEAPLIVAASTHAPEEKWILEAFRNVRQNVKANSPRLLIAPRHPERFDEVAKLSKEAGFQLARRSQKLSERDTSAEVILFDSIGELRAAYHLAEIVFVGGSLIPHGGQSFLEPALARKAIVTGFYTINFASAAKEFVAQNALVQMPQINENDIADKLCETFLNLLRDTTLRETLAENAFAVMENNCGAAAKTVELLKPLLQNLYKK
jgi:3-deoxy-D-manno-octulosonic-acid transferase